MVNFFCRKECDEVADELRRAKIAALPYHAGLNDKERTDVQMRWIREEGCKVNCRHFPSLLITSVPQVV